MRHGSHTCLGLLPIGLAALLSLTACSKKAVPPPTPESSADNSAASAPAGPAPQRTNQDKPQGATGPQISAPSPTAAPSSERASKS